MGKNPKHTHKAFLKKAFIVITSQSDLMFLSNSPQSIKGNHSTARKVLYNNLLLWALLTSYYPSSLPIPVLECHHGVDCARLASAHPLYADVHINRLWQNWKKTIKIVIIWVGRKYHCRKPQSERWACEDRREMYLMLKTYRRPYLISVRIPGDGEMIVEVG